MIVKIMNRLIDTLEKDENINVVISAFEIIQELCMDLGPAAVDRKLDNIVHYLIKVFNNDTNAQNQAYEVFTMK